MLCFNDMIIPRSLTLKAWVFSLLIAITLLDPSMASALTAGLTQPVAFEEESDDERDESGKVDLGLEADLEFAYEKRGGSESSDVTFDEVGFLVDGDWWQVGTGINYESASKDIQAEEVVVRLGGTEDFPWFFQIGRMVLPFGEFNTQFTEDPLGTIIGETDENALVFGCKSDNLEAFFGFYRGDRGTRDGINVVTSARIMAGRHIDVGIGFSNDLGESVELREFSYDRANGPDTIEAAGDDIAGLTGCLLVGIEPVQISLEYLTALRSFGAGFLDENPRRPSTFNIEFGVQPFDAWTVSTRVESSHEFPENPEWQYGVSMSYELNEQIGCTVEYLYGDFGGDSDDRHLVSSALTLEY